jgi:LacI family transcriptional regulator
MSRKVSLKDIAKEVGVSTALVSYVLNNLKEGRIRKEVAQRIREVAQRLNYRPNQVARSLKMRKTLTIGVIVADISNPFSSALARILEDEANGIGYTVIFGSSDENPGKFNRLVETFVNRQVDGLILSPPEGAEQKLLDLQQADVPFVLLDRYYPGLDTNYVILDNLGASYTATKHLIDSGCSRVAMVSYSSELVHLVDRERGYWSALADAGRPADPALVTKVSIDNKPHMIRASFDELLKASPDGVLFASNIIATSCLSRLNQLPIRVPGDIRVVCFDETSSLDLFYAPLTCIRQPMQQMGKAAIDILVEHMSHEKEATRLKIPGELIVRD